MEHKYRVNPSTPCKQVSFTEIARGGVFQRLCLTQLLASIVFVIEKGRTVVKGFSSMNLSVLVGGWLDGLFIH